MDTTQDIRNQDINDLAKEIRQRVFALRNGEVAAQMRQGGVDYGKNYGLLLPQLRGIADDYPRSLALSEALLAVDAREYRLLSLMLFPTDASLEQLTARAARLEYDEEAEVFALVTTPKMEAAPLWATQQLNADASSSTLLAALMTLFRLAGCLSEDARRQLLTPMATLSLTTASNARMAGKLLAELALLDAPEEEQRYRDALAAISADEALRPVLEHHFRQEMGE